MIFKQPDGSWIQTGIVSFGSKEGCQKNYPNGYTRVSSYSSWIQGIVPSLPIRPTTSPRPNSSGRTSKSLLLFSFICICWILTLVC